jgi:DnaK suppressor protein
MASTMSKGLSKAQIKKFKKMLEEKAEDIRGNLRSAAATVALARGEEPLDLEELPTQSHEEWIFLNRNSIDVMLLREIEEALKRIEDGTYGVCMESGEPISLKRLDAIPWARYCMRVQEELAAAQQADDETAYSYRR